MMMLFLTGCAQQSYFIQVNDDSTVNFAMEMSLQEAAVNKLDDLNIQREEILESKEPLFKEVKEFYEKKGFSYTFSDSDGQLKVVLKKVYPSISDFNSEIKEFYDNGKSGLGLHIDKNSGLSGSSVKYKGGLKFVADPDFVKIAEKNPHLIKYLNTVPINAYVTIYDKHKVVNIDSLDDEKTQYTTMINGNWDLSREQPVKTFFLETENKNQTFALIVFFGILAVIVILLVLVFGKGKKYDLSASLKKRRLEKDDN